MAKKDVKTTMVETTKKFAHFIIDKIDGGLVTHSMDICDCVVDFLEITEKE